MAERVGDNRPQFDFRGDRRLLGTVACIPVALLAVGLWALVAGAEYRAVLALLGGHFVAQFIVLLVYAGLVMNDEGLERAGRTMWWVSFAVAAPVAVPLYFWFRVRPGAPREPHAIVRDCSHPS
jgi:hypothetical protein